AVSPDYFRAMRIPLVRGRGFTEQDSAAAPRVAIINETMARRIWPGKDPVGQRLTMGIDSQAVREVVGVVKDVRHYGLDADTTMQMYEPFQQNSRDSVDVLVRTASSPTI